MSFWGDLGNTCSDAWNGKSTMWGNAAATVCDVGKSIPLFGAMVPDGAEAAAKVNSWTGADQDDPNKQGNIGNKIGTVAGGVLGLALGPAGAAEGAALGSAAGGWIGKALGANREDDTGPITVPLPTDPYAYPPQQMVPEAP